MEPYPYTCGDCSHFFREVRDSDTTGATLDARTCNNPAFADEMGKCPTAYDRGCLLHSELRRKAQEAREGMYPPYTSKFGNRFMEAGGYRGLYALRSEIESALLHAIETIKNNQHNGILPSIGAALMQADLERVQREVFQALGAAIEDFIEPALQYTLAQAVVHVDDVVTLLEQRNSVIERELKELREMVMRLQSPTGKESLPQE